jgi:hypothetical protein
MRLQENFELLKKRDVSMMLFLSLDVTVDLGQHRLTHCERAVSFLPLEAGAVLECSRDPAGGIRFQFTNQLRDCLVLSQLCQDVNVVSGSVDDHRDSFFVANRAAEIFMRSGTNFCPQPGLASLCREDDVIEQIAIGGTHGRAPFRRPLSGALFFLHNTPGVPLCSTPGFNSGAPSGCSRGARFRGRRKEIPSVKGILLKESLSSHFRVAAHMAAPEARRNTGRSGAQRNSGKPFSKWSNPWQGVTEMRFCKGDESANCLRVIQYE